MALYFVLRGIDEVISAKPTNRAKLNSKDQQALEHHIV